MFRIFISYRRKDSAAAAGRIYDFLSSRFGTDNVFMDIESIPPGVDFRAFFEKTSSNSSTLIVVIGPAWLTAADEAGRRRLDHEDDGVRREIELALAAGIPVFPVLVGGTKVPPASHLPASLSPLARLNTFELPDAQFRARMEELASHIAGVGGLKAVRTEARAPEQISCITLTEDSSESCGITASATARLTIGRSPANDLVVPDEIVSWEHGEIALREGAYRYRHLSHRNPTILRRRGSEFLFRGGKRNERNLLPGDRLIIGSHTFIVEFTLIELDAAYVTTKRAPAPIP